MTPFTEQDLRTALTADADTVETPVDIWPRLQRGRVRQRRTRAAITVVAVGAVAAGVFIAVPRDGGTTPLPPALGNGRTLVPNRPLSSSELAVAANVMRDRLDSLGVQRAVVAIENGTLVIDASGTTPADIAAIAVQGELQYRPVFGVKAATGGNLEPGWLTAPTLDVAARGWNGQDNCDRRVPGSAGEPTATSYLVACSTDDHEQFLLGPARVDNASVADATAMHDDVANEWAVQLTFTNNGADEFFDLTNAVGGKPEVGACGPPDGCNAIAIVVDGEVLSAPTVLNPGGISGGVSQIAGGLTKEEAQTIAALAGSDPLPTGFTIKADS